MGQYTFTPVRDGWIQGNPESTKTQNFGSETLLAMGEQVDIILGKIGLYRSHLEFDVSSLAGKTLVSADLRVYVADGVPVGGDLNCTMRRIKRAWFESQQTWNIYSTGNNWGTAGASHADDVANAGFDSPETLDAFTAPPDAEAGGWKNLSGYGLAILPMVQDAVTNRAGACKFQFRMNAENNGWPGNMWTFHSKEGDNPPQLIVNDNQVSLPHVRGRSLRPLVVR